METSEEYYGGDDETVEEIEEIEEIEEEADAGEESDESEEEAEEVKTKADIDDLLEEGSLDKKIKVKVDGEEIITTVRELQKGYQLESASRKRMQEAAEHKKMALSLLDLAKTDKKKFFEITGEDPYEFAEATLAEKLEMMGMSDEQRESLKLKEENKNLKQRAEAFDRQEKEKTHNAEVQREYERLEKEVTEAWTESGLPDGKMFKASIAQTIIADQKMKDKQRTEGLDPEPYLTASGAASIVKENWLKSVGHTFNKMDAEAILKVLDKDTVKKIQQAEIKRVSAKTSPEYSKSRPGSKPASKAKRPESTEDAYRKWQESLLS